MKGLDLFLSVSSVSDEYIKELSPDIMIPRRIVSFKRVTLVAACMAILICSVVYIPLAVSQGNETDISIGSETGGESFVESLFPIVSEPDTSKSDTSELPIYSENGADFTAAEIASIFDNSRKDGITSYQVFKFQSIDDIMLGALPNGNELPVFRYENINWTYIDVSIGGSLEDSVFINGKTIQLSKDATYEDAYQAVLEMLPTLQEYFGFEYSDITVVESRTTNEYSAYIYNSAEKNIMFENGIPFMSSGNYLGLHIGCKLHPCDFISLNSLVYYGNSSTLENAASYNTISLAEAEELLNKGYTFGGHTCRRCMSEQTEVDFSNYDRVGIEYVTNLENTFVYPFYAFYKDLGNGEFARTYVTAYRVSEIDEYFASQEALH